jgi:hypothetical protein
MADYEDGEEEALGWWMTAILKATKNMARSKQKKPKVDPKFGDRKYPLSQIYLMLSNKSELCVHLYQAEVTEIRKKISP